MAYWAATRLEARREKLAQYFLEEAGYEVYLPKVWQRRRRGGRRFKALSPLFPGYLFTRIELPWRSVRSCPGVVKRSSSRQQARPFAARRAVVDHDALVMDLVRLEPPGDQQAPDRAHDAMHQAMHRRSLLAPLYGANQGTARCGYRHSDPSPVRRLLFLLSLARLALTPFPSTGRSILFRRRQADCETRSARTHVFAYLTLLRSLNLNWGSCAALS